MGRTKEHQDGIKPGSRYDRKQRIRCVLRPRLPLATCRCSRINMGNTANQAFLDSISLVGIQVSSCSTSSAPSRANVVLESLRVGMVMVQAIVSTLAHLPWQRGAFTSLHRQTRIIAPSAAPFLHLALPFTIFL
jgi:hypothetical protein